jgi:ATP-dependent protease ClpP protease subunit
MTKIARIVIDKNISTHDVYAEMFGEVQPCFSSNEMSDFIKNNADADVIEVELRSDGGNTTQGFEIYDLLKASGKKIVTIAYRANSIASVIFLAGEERKISKNAQFVIHNPFIDPWGLGFEGLTADDLVAIADEVRDVEERILNLYAEVLGLDDAKKEEIKGLMKDDTDLGSDKALEYGFATAIIASDPKATKSVKVAAYSNAIAALLKDKPHHKSNNIMTKTEFESGLKKIEDLIKNAFKKREVKNGTKKLEDGTTLYFDGEELAVGTVLYSDEAMETLAPAGNHTLEDGSTIEVGDDGAIATITPKAAEPEDAATTIANLTQEVENLKAQINAEKVKTADAIKNAQKQSTDFIDTLKTEIANLKKFVPGETKEIKGSTGKREENDPVRARIEKQRILRGVGKEEPTND